MRWLPEGELVVTIDRDFIERHWVVATVLLEAELVRRVGEVHSEGSPWRQRDADACGGGRSRLARVECGEGRGRSGV